MIVNVKLSATRLIALVLAVSAVALDAGAAPVGSEAHGEDYRLDHGCSSIPVQRH
jgi:hypothetical protein